jgi:hypothetical protein
VLKRWLLPYSNPVVLCWHSVLEWGLLAAIVSDRSTLHVCPTHQTQVLNAGTHWTY